MMMLTCGQEVDVGQACGKPAKRRAHLPWDPGDTSGCCASCLATYVADKDFTPEEAERFFPIVSDGG